MTNTQTLSRPNGFLKTSFFVLLAALALTLTTPRQGYSRVAGDSFADLAEQISPSVVNIVTSVAVAGRGGQRPIVPEGSPLEDLFNDFLDQQEPDERPQLRGEALGSGFIISADGYIVTNNHVIEGADEITIEMFSGETAVATLIGTDERTDIAVLKIDYDAPLPFVQFGDSDIARVGDWVMAMGNPLGQGFSVSAGIISARNRSLSGSYDDFIQTDAAINQGNSGGPLFNMDGAVIGVNTAILSPNGGSIGIGFSMSSAVVTRVVDQLIEHGETRRGWLGVRIQDISDDVAEALELADTSGALVTDVPEGPALDGGIEAGDVIITFDGKPVENIRELVSTVAETDVGKTVRVVVMRDGATQTLLITIGRLEEVILASAEPEVEGDVAPALEILGITLGTLSADNIEKFGIGDVSEGVLITDVDTTSDAFDKGLRPGDVITEAGQQEVREPQDILTRIDMAKEGGRSSILFLVNHDGDKRFVAISLE